MRRGRKHRSGDVDQEFCSTNPDFQHDAGRLNAQHAHSLLAESLIFHPPRFFPFLVVDATSSLRSDGGGLIDHKHDRAVLFQLSNQRSRRFMIGQPAIEKTLAFAIQYHRMMRDFT
jgi:hypothetical protein